VFQIPLSLSEQLNYLFLKTCIMLQEFHDRGIYLTEDEYRSGLRTLFSEAYQELSDEELEDILYDKISRMSPAEAEGFLSSVGDFFKKQVAPIAIAALPAAATIAGTVIGGPAGAAIGSTVGGLASNAISSATHIKPNPIVASVGNVATSLASGNIQAAIPGIISAGRDVGNAIKPGAGNVVAGVATNLAQAGTSIASGNYQAAIPGIIGAGRDIGNAIKPGAGNQVANVATNIAQIAQPFIPGGQNSTPASSQLLGFLQSTPFLQSLLSTIATGSTGTGLKIPAEDGSFRDSSYVEMLESLKYLTENAISEADNAGFSGRLPIESEAEQDQYIGELIEAVSNYENSLLPNYDSITYN
jgi:hypothetical protein